MKISRITDNQPSNLEGASTRKTREIIRLAIEELKQRDPGCIIATEYKSQLISAKPLNLPADAPVVSVIFVPENENAADNTRRELYNVHFDGPHAIKIEELLHYVRTMEDESDPTGVEFPKFASAVDALDIIIGYMPRSLPNVSSVDSSRFFPFATPGNSAPLGRERGLLAVRGYFQSARLATGRVLINTNTSHGVFHGEMAVAELVRHMRLAVMGSDRQPPNEIERRLRALHNLISLVRVEYRIPNGGGSGKHITIRKRILGLAAREDVRRETINPSKFLFRFGGPSEVKIFLDKPVEGTKLQSGYVTVEDYFKARRTPFCPANIVGC
jgi:eukaryotic translation initiation factor 2C